MSPSLALLVWLVLLLALLLFDPARDRKSSLALWAPVTWMFFLGSRLPSQWLLGYTGAVLVSANAAMEGNPLDRTVDLILISLAVGVLVSRSFKWGEFFRRNFALVAFFAFALVSVLWSDFPFIAFKRWFRDLGGYLMVLVVISDPRPLEAVRMVLRKVGYLLVPLSILLIKYYPNLAKQYDPWSGAASYSGAATSKNMLGVLCLVSGLFFFWDSVLCWSRRKEKRTRRIILVNGAFLAMTFWLLQLSNSATSRVCLLLGCLAVAAAHSRMFQRRPKLLKVLVPSTFLLYLVLVFGFNLNGKMNKAVGRKGNFTDRTVIWSAVLATRTNPLVGTGYESFWLGPRARWVHSQPGVGPVNETHNGYLDAYVNLGAIGLFLIAGFLVASYRTVCRKVEPLSGLGSLSLAVWIVLLFYNITEAALYGGLLWLVLLMGTLSLPAHAWHEQSETGMPEFVESSAFAVPAGPDSWG
jgi:exopolysaccharide production protein ExoQ